MDRRWARPWFAATVVCVVSGIGISVFRSADNPAIFGGSPLNRALNVFAYFTIQSNLLVGGACLLLALNTQRRSMAFAVLRLTGLVAITVTFIVFHVALSALLDLDTWGQVANQLQHTIVPVLAIVGWLAFGPRGLTSASIVKWTALFPLAYMIFTVIRGPLASHFYPYPFADVNTLGYARAAVNGVWIALLFVGLAAAAAALDRRMSPAQPTAQTATRPPP